MPAAIDGRQARGITSSRACPEPEVDRKGWISPTPAYLLLTALLAALAGGCAGASDEPVEVRVAPPTSDPSIFGGAKDDDAFSVAGVVALRVGKGGTFELCSGAVLAPNLVLTARHCVTRNLTSSVACDEDGRSVNGEHVAGDQAPEDIAVFVGATPSFSAQPTARARSIVAPSGPYLCDADIALVVLDHPLTAVAPLPVRLGSAARTGETIRSVGYGQNDEKQPIGTRFRRSGVEVLAQGQAISASKTPLGPHEFEVGKSICQGDSGGPAISEDTGAVIGVVSRGGNCDQDFGHIYTTTAGFEDLFAEAFREAGASIRLETADPQGARAAAASDNAAGSQSSGGCSSSPSRGGSAPTLALVLAAALVLRSRRRS
jgi:uncharacterized protein (TIGR03382 family)